MPGIGEERERERENAEGKARWQNRENGKRGIWKP